MSTSHIDSINDHLARINTGLGPVDSICADADEQPEGLVRVYDDHDDCVCDAERLAAGLADVGEGDWDGAWDVILDCKAEPNDLTNRCRATLARLRVGSLMTGEIDEDVLDVLTDRGLVEQRPNVPAQTWLTGRGRGVDASTFDG